MSIAVTHLEMGKLTIDWVWTQWTHCELDLEQSSVDYMIPIYSSAMIMAGINVISDPGSISP